MAALLWMVVGTSRKNRRSGIAAETQLERVDGCLTRNVIQPRIRPLCVATLTHTGRLSGLFILTAIRHPATDRKCRNSKGGLQDRGR